MPKILTVLGGAISLCVLLSLAGCSSAKPLVRTETVEVVVERMVPVPAKLTARETIRPYVAPIRTRQLEEHDGQCTAALDRANGKLGAIECLGAAPDAAAVARCMDGQ